jgi:hypothetical protein
MPEFPFHSKLQSLAVELPLSVSEDDIGVVLDANGREVFTVDVNNDRPDEEVDRITDWLVVAINTAAMTGAAERADG